MIKPTIGRVVLYKFDTSEDRWPALVCFVHSDTLINIGGFDHQCNAFGKSSVTLAQDRPAEIGEAEWMPYQKGQAAKAEQLEKELSKKEGE